MSDTIASHTNEDQTLAVLDQRIHATRRVIDAYLMSARRRRDRLVRATIVGGSIAAALTAGPGFGGKSFSDWLGETFGLTNPAWQILCLAAMLCALAATIATQLNRSHRNEENIVRAQGARVALEVLDVGITSGSLDGQEAMRQFQRCLENISFLAPGEV